MIPPKDRRRVAGVMSGTSLDGIDVVIADLQGHGRQLRIIDWYGSSFAFSEELSDHLATAASEESIGVAELSQLNVRLAHEYAQAITQTLATREDSIQSLDLVGCHGQTIRHLPEKAPYLGIQIRSTLQIGDPATLAQLLGLPVIGDFRLADMACGGQGAPLVPYFDYVIFTHETEVRGCLNLGGVANLTVLPSGASVDQVYGFDTGPANMIIDALCSRLLGLPFDEGGEIAKSGRVNEALLSELLLDDYFLSLPPKSTGRDYLNRRFLRRLLDLSNHMSAKDLIATATALTAVSVWRAYKAFVEPQHAINRLIVSGGGAHNQTLMDLLKDCFARNGCAVDIETSDSYGIGVDSKEALCFAVLAHETANGIPTSIPSVTGADRTAVLGKLCVP
ncbi:MAG: anhydro-N-acetylmuramic acid kinase [Bacteroidota bacterium]|nr:anhydro-N-acetylmuramic acid kinase [Bacteroidota bacterium]